MPKNRLARRRGEETPLVEGPASSRRPAHGSIAQHHETIIVGGGIAGLACARRLREADRDFRLITTRVGGRIRPSLDGSANLGAYYVRADYHHVNGYIERGRPLVDLAFRIHDSSGSHVGLDLRNLRFAPQAARFLRILRRFHARYAAFQAACVTTSQAEVLRSDPWLWDLYREPALHFVGRHQVEGFARRMLAPVLRGTIFVPLDRLSAYTLLLGALPAIVPTHEFTARFDRLLDGLAGAVLVDEVVEIVRRAGSYQIDTRSLGSFSTKHVVVATPAGVSKRLLALEAVKGSVSAHIFHVGGVLRSRFAGDALNFFSDDDPLFALAVQANGTTIVAAADEHPDFGRYFTTWHVIEHEYWDPAFNLVGHELLDCEVRPNLFLVGDHNVCGLEDAYITGLYAGNRILAGGSASRRAG